jgi:putative ABC transport system permease protein
MMSWVLGDDVRVIAEAPGVARDQAVALASPELFVIITLKKRSTGSDANVPLRGITRIAPLVRDNFELVEGRMFEWGRNEVVWPRAQPFEARDWLKADERKGAVVGVFRAGGGQPRRIGWMRWCCGPAPARPPAG